jgi:hypothetical protein
MTTPLVCNKFVERGCQPFDSCGYPVNELSSVNKKELVHIFIWLCRRYEHDKSPDIKRKIKAMEKVLKFFELYEESRPHEGREREKGEI